MKKTFLLLLTFTLFYCNDSDDRIDLTVYNPELTVLENLDNGVSAFSITEALGVASLYGVEYAGGFIYHFDQVAGFLYIASDYSSIGPSSWGDHFDLTNSAEIGAGLANTQQIVDGNLNDNSNVTNGLEFGSDDYVFKIVTDLEYQSYDDWFVPSGDSMKAIYDNVHSQDQGDFDETLVYWTSTKVGYSPLVMGFNTNWGGELFLGSCFNSNGVMLVRKELVAQD